MRFYQQTGFNLERTQLNQSDNVCDCCRGFDHGAAEYHHDDVECKKCGKLCCCSCHR